MISSFRAAYMVILIFEGLADTEIGYFNIVQVINKDILGFNISMNNLVIVDVLQTCNAVAHDSLDDLFTQKLNAFDIRHEKLFLDIPSHDFFEVAIV